MKDFNLENHFEWRAYDKFDKGDMAGADADLATAIHLCSHGDAWHLHDSRAWIRMTQNHFDRENLY